MVSKKAISFLPLILSVLFYVLLFCSHILNFNHLNEDEDEKKPAATHTGGYAMLGHKNKTSTQEFYFL
ncbi:MAG: hypothetical protein ACYDCN_10100 [Bacteroidia bacterium]